MTYVISDIHACLDIYKKMLRVISFSTSDRLILAGDYIDRGPQNLEMLRYLERVPKRITLLKGNHDAEFVSYVNLMERVDREQRLDTDPQSPSDMTALYETTKYLLKKTQPDGARFFDYYGTIQELVSHGTLTLQDFRKWAKLFGQLPYYIRLRNTPMWGHTTIVVHAGYREKEADESDESIQDFYLYAREDAYTKGGIPRGIVIAGHTPTVLPDQWAYNKGHVMRKYKEDIQCTIYDIDCGCAYRAKYPRGKLACLRVEDEHIFYV